MNGNEIVERKKNEKINNLINKNTDKPYLIGFKNFMGTRTSLNTKYDYIRFVVKFMDWNKKDVSDVNLDDYTSFLNNYENNVVSYQIAMYSALKKFSEYLYASEKNKSNPMAHVQRPQFKESTETIEKRNKGWMDTKEIKKYIAAVEKGSGSERSKNRQKEWKERDLLIVLLFLNTGIRCTALCKLDLENIDFKNQKLLVIDKGDHIKTFDLSDELMVYIYEWLEKRDILLKGKQESALFIANRRERMCSGAVAKVVKKYAEGIKGKNITPHKLRASYGTALYDSTKDVYFVQKMMGHSSPKVTENYIRGQEDVNSQKAANIMSKITIRKS